jgi:hypothetical protein
MTSNISHHGAAGFDPGMACAFVDIITPENKGFIVSG